MKTEQSLEFTDSKMLLTWKMDNLKKRLVYVADHCFGCILCEVSCPELAIKLGPIPEIATGELKAPPILIDQDKCIFCGICANVCPPHAIDFTFNDRSVTEMEEYPKLLGSINIKDGCIPCLLCEKICPRDAFKLNLKVEKKDNLVIYKTEPGKIEGTIDIDKEKCTYCGLCEELCDAIKINWLDPSGGALVPADDIVVDEEKCDYCGLCEKICPSEAARVECKTKTDREIKELVIEGSLELDEEKCTYCGWCALICPVDAVEYDKPLKGEISITDLEKCDPIGCKACINICPSKAWYIPKTPEHKQKHGKIAVNKDICIFCGSCQNACPENLITVTRDKIKATEAPKTPWLSSWKCAFDKIIGRLSDSPKIRLIPVEISKPVEKPLPTKPLPRISAKAKETLRRVGNILDKELRTVKLRRWAELGKVEGIDKEVKKLKQRS
ncbi:MAG: 4Fe-4S binding protein [Promethearchaeota archaeon]